MTYHLLDLDLTNGSILAPAPDPDKPIRISRFYTYPNQVLFLVASFIGLVILCHFLTLGYTLSRRGKMRAAKLPSRRGKISLKRVPVAIADTFRALAFRWTIPIGRYYTLNVAEVFLTAAYGAVLFTWTMINTTTTTGIKVEPHYWGNRAGTIAATQLPIMTALGMRNNLVSLLTGVSFDKLNYLHRMSARVLCVLVWLHGAGRLKIGLIVSDDGTIFDRWVQCGLLAGSALAILCITTVRPIRERSYEIFLVAHFLFAFIFLLSVYFHTQARGLVFYGIWPSFLLWGIDWFLRLIRIVLFNSSLFSAKRRTQSPVELGNAVVDVLSPHFLRITLPRPHYFHWLPGQSAYLSFPGISTSPFENHPFTISSINEPAGDPEKQRGDRSLVFLVRVRKGATRKLLEHASRSVQAPLKVFIDGPYSSPPLLVGFDTVVLIAGGSGVAFTLPLFTDLVRRANLGEQQYCSRIVFVWAVRDADHISWISEPLNRALQDIPASIAVDIRFYFTATAGDAQAWDDDAVESTEGGLEDPDAKASSSSQGSSSEPQVLDPDLVRVQQGRPDLAKILEEETGRAAGPISVNVCGTHALASAVRKVLRRPRALDILRGGPSVTLHVEAFGSAIVKERERKVRSTVDIKTLHSR